MVALITEALRDVLREHPGYVAPYQRDRCLPLLAAAAARAAWRHQRPT